MAWLGIRRALPNPLWLKAEGLCSAFDYAVLFLHSLRQHCPEWNLLEVTWACFFALALITGGWQPPASNCWSGSIPPKLRMNKNGYIDYSWSYGGCGGRNRCSALVLLPLWTHVATGQYDRTKAVHFDQKHSLKLEKPWHWLEVQSTLHLSLPLRPTLIPAGPHSRRVPGLPTPGKAVIHDRADVRSHQPHCYTATSCCQNMLVCPDNPVC